jgi:hypothetical protein
MTWEISFWVGAAIVLVSYGGYGLWVAALAWARPTRTKAEYLSDDRLPPVTCVIAAADEGALIGRKLGILERQDYPQDKIRVIVVSDGSTDGTDELLAEWAARDQRLRVLRLPSRSGKPTALNVARPFIDTPIAIFMDVRQDLTVSAIQHLVAHLADPTVGAVSGDLRVAGDSYWTYEGVVRKLESRSGSMVQVTGSLYAIRTTDVPIIPPDTILDDVYVPLTIARSGRRIVMAEGAGSLDVATRSIGHEFVRKVRTLAGLVQICHTVDGCMNPVRNRVWGRFVVHKLFRLLCPYGLLLMLGGSFMASGWFYRVAFAGAMALGAMALGGTVGIRSSLTSISRSLLALNLAALSAVPAYYLGWASVTWARVERDRV